MKTQLATSAGRKSVTFAEVPEKNSLKRLQTFSAMTGKRQNYCGSDIFQFEHRKFKSYVAVNHKHTTQSKPRAVKISSTPAFEIWKKASSIALTRRWLELKQIICLMLQTILTKHGIYT